MTEALSRRHLLARAAAGGAAFAAGSLARPAAAEEQLAPFLHGVASGDPLADRVMLWTRVDPGSSTGPLAVTWTIARDPALSDVVAGGELSAGPERDWCVKVDATGLQPGTTYFYGFRALGASSLTGRTKTAPAGAVDRVRFGVVSCSNLPAGWFNAYRLLAERQDLDAVLHLGDYLYENGNSGDGGARTVVPDREMVTLEDYRLRWSSYRLDPDLRRLHQQYAFVCVWDDHESTNDSWRGGAENHQPDEGDWFVRKRLATKVYEEWLPIRVPDQSGRGADDGVRLYRALPYGSMVDLLMLDTRLEGRSQQTGDLPEGPDAASDDPRRTLLGYEQEQWVADELASSVRRGTRWRVLGQQVMLAHLNAAGLPDTPQVRFVRRGGVALNPDQWDGYAAARRRLYEVVKGANPAGEAVGNLVVLTGDIHTSWANDLPEDPYNPTIYNPATGDGSLGVEFVTPSVTSGNFESLGPAVPALEAAVTAENPHIKFADLDRHGYLVLDLTEQRARSDWFFVDTIATRGGGESHGAAWESRSGDSHLTQATGDAPTGTAAPAAPPTPPGAGPEPVVPEVSTPILLPAAAAVVGGAIALRRRRQTVTPNLEER